MLIYVIFIILAVIGALFFDRQEQKDKVEPFFYWGLWAYLILMAGLSYGLGGDTFFYLSDYKELHPAMSLGRYIQTQFREESYMPLWSAFVYCSKNVLGSYTAFQLLLSLVVDVTIGYLITRYTNRHFLFLLLFFISKTYFLYNCETLREAMAIVSCMIAIEGYFRKRYTQYALFVAIGILFHVSAITMLLVPLVGWHVDKRLFVLISGVAVLGWGLVAGFTAFVLPVLSFLPDVLNEKITYYTSMGASVWGLLQLYVRYIVLPFVVGYCCLQWEQDEERKQRMERLMVMQLVIGCGITMGGFGMVRFGNYMLPYYLCWMAEFVYMLFHERKMLFVRLFTVVLFLCFVVVDYAYYMPMSRRYAYEFYVPYTSYKTQPQVVQYREQMHKESTKR